MQVYIFDKDLIESKGIANAQAYVKGIFQALLTRPQEQNEIFDVIWANTSLRGDLWKPQDYPNGITPQQAKSLFQNWVSDTNHSIYNFIEVK